MVIPPAYYCTAYNPVVLSKRSESLHTPPFPILLHLQGFIWTDQFHDQSSPDETFRFSNRFIFMDFELTLSVFG